MTEICKDYIKIVFKNHMDEDEICFIKKDPSVSDSELKNIMKEEMLQGHETYVEHADCGFSPNDKKVLNHALDWFANNYNIVYKDKHHKNNYSKYKELIQSNFDSKSVIEVVVDTSRYYDLGSDVLKGRNITVGELCLEYPEWVNFTIMKGNKILITGIDNYDVQDDDFKYYKDKVLEAYQSEDEASVFIKIK